MLRVLLLTLLITSALLVSCSSTGERADEKAGDKKKQDKKADKKDTDLQTAPSTASSPSSEECDQAFWQWVYDRSRLEVIADCKVATGTIVEQDQNEDGDTHMLLKLDPGQDYLLAKKNYKKKEGNLVIEVVCAHPPSDKKARKTCEGYQTPVAIPAMGDHVRVAGPYVNDTHNGWTEIHPVTSIQKQ